MNVSTEIFRTDGVLLEAPNWITDDALVLNGDDVLFRLSIADANIERLEFSGLPRLNNDHVWGVDGDTMFVSGMDLHIHRVSLSTGEHERITPDYDDRRRYHFLHGVSPDGTALAYTGVEPTGDDPWGPANIFTIPVTGGESRQLTFGDVAADGPEYSPDGEWIYFNTDQIFRIRPDGSERTQLTSDDRVNWFPHLSPDLVTAYYLSYEPGTKGHPADRDVELRLVREDNWSEPTTVVELFGGQGTCNVNSWSPDGRRFAYVAYPLTSSS